MPRVQDIQKIIAEKVTGQWEPNHDSSGHKYIHIASGISQRSVTTKLGILSAPHLLPWAVKMGLDWLLQSDRLERLRNPLYVDEMRAGAILAHTEYRDQMGSTGSRTHSFAERYLNDWIASGEKPKDISVFMDAAKDDPRAIAASRSFEKVCLEKDIVPIASEIIVGNPKYSCGALDILCLWEGQLCLLDIKTSGQMDKKFRYQLAAYRFFFEFMTGIHIKKTKILHLSRDMDKYAIYDVKDMHGAWKTFKWICGIYDDVMSTKEKIVKDIKRLTI